jgi:hypothetical protein
LELREVRFNQRATRGPSLERIEQHPSRGDAFKLGRFGARHARFHSFLDQRFGSLPSASRNTSIFAEHALASRCWEQSC